MKALMPSRRERNYSFRIIDYSAIIPNDPRNIGIIFNTNVALYLKDYVLRKGASWSGVGYNIPQGYMNALYTVGGVTRRIVARRVYRFAHPYGSVPTFEILMDLKS